MRPRPSRRPGGRLPVSPTRPVDGRSGGPGGTCPQPRLPWQTVRCARRLRRTRREVRGSDRTGRSRAAHRRAARDGGNARTAAAAEVAFRGIADRVAATGYQALDICRRPLGIERRSRSGARSHPGSARDRRGTRSLAAGAGRRRANARVSTSCLRFPRGAPGSPSSLGTRTHWRRRTNSWRGRIWRRTTKRARPWSLPACSWRSCSNSGAAARHSTRTRRASRRETPAAAAPSETREGDRGLELTGRCARVRRPDRRSAGRLREIILQHAGARVGSRAWEAARTRAAWSRN